MIRMNKETDYGIILLAHFATVHEGSTHSAREAAEETYLPLPMVSKVLKMLARQGFLLSHRGVKGGYSLARQPDGISMAEIIGAIEGGPIAMTECAEVDGECRHEPVCQLKPTWQRINEAVLVALGNISLSDLVGSPPEPFGEGKAGRLVTLQ